MSRIFHVLSHYWHDIYINMWKKVLNKKGEALKVEENQDLAMQYNHDFSYALFIENANGVGGFLSKKGHLTGLSQAQLFQTEQLARQEVGISVIKHPNSAIVKINIAFQEVVKTFGSVNTDILDKVLITQEKEKLELSHANEAEMIQYLMSKYGEKHPEIIKALEKISMIEPNNTSKKKVKI